MIRLDELAAVDVMLDLDAAERALVLPLLSERFTSRGEVLFREGEEGDTVLLILDGVVEVSIAGPGGSVVPLAHIGRGWMIGEIALLDGGPRSATCTAVGSCRLAVLRRADFDALAAQHPTLGCRLLRRLGKMLAMRLRRSSAMTT